MASRMNTLAQTRVYADREDYWAVYTSHRGCKVREHLGVNAFDQLQLDVVRSTPIELARDWRQEGGRAWP